MSRLRRPSPPGKQWLSKLQDQKKGCQPVESLPQAQLVKKCIGHVWGGCAAGQCKLHARLAQAVQDSAQTQDGAAMRAALASRVCVAPVVSAAEQTLKGTPVRPPQRCTHGRTSGYSQGVSEGVNISHQNGHRV